jgi:hypothetical protein
MDGVVEIRNIYKSVFGKFKGEGKIIPSPLNSFPFKFSNYNWGLA